MYTIKIGRCLDYDFYKSLSHWHAFSLLETRANISDMTLEWFVDYKFD